MTAEQTASGTRRAGNADNDIHARTAALFAEMAAAEGPAADGARCALSAGLGESMRS